MIKHFHQLREHQGFRKYFANTSWLFAEKILRMIAGLFVGIWIARYLGPEQFGLFNYVISFVGLFTAIATLGLDSIVIQALVKGTYNKSQLPGTVFWLKLIGSFSVLLILSIAINFTSNDRYTNTLIFIIASALLFQSFNIIDLYFQSKVMSKFTAYANFITVSISSAIKIILILDEAPLIAFTYVVLFDSFILASSLIYFFIKHSEFKLIELTFNRFIAIDLLKESWPLILIGVLISINMKIDQVMIKEMLDTSAIGQYAAAVKLSEIWYIIPMIITSSIFPAIINAKAQSEELYLKRLQTLYDILIWISIAIALLMTFVSDWLVNLLYGSQYNQAGSVLMIHIYSLLFISIQNIGGKWVIAEGFQKSALLRAFIGALINILLNYLLIPIYGIIGAAYATLISYSFTGYISNILFKNHHIHLWIITKAFLLPLRIIMNK